MNEWIWGKKQNNNKKEKPRLNSELLMVRTQVSARL
jgi:hypothetical protein